MTSKASAKLIRVPTGGDLEARHCASTVCVSSKRSTNTSTLPPVSFTPKKRAFKTRVLFKTSRSPACNKLGKSVKLRSMQASRFTCKSRDAEREASGTCAFSAGGKSKLKSESEYTRLADQGQKPVFYAGLPIMLLYACHEKKIRSE